MALSYRRHIVQLYYSPIKINQLIKSNKLWSVINTETSRVWRSADLKVLGVMVMNQ